MVAGDTPTPACLPALVSTLQPTAGATTMDMSIYHNDFTQHDLFGLFPGAPGGRALRDTYGRDHLISIATKGGQTTLERYGKEYMRELASRGGKAKRHKEDTQP